jgi:hypothetical protein
MILNYDDIHAYSRAKTPVDDELFFMAIVNRLSGRPNIYNEYKRSRNASCCIPLRKEIESFVEFVEQNRARVRLFSSQHAESIPSDVRTNDVVLRRVLLSIAQTSADVLRRTLIASCRREAVSIIGTYLFEVFETNKTHLTERTRSPDKANFIAHQIVADLEEIYIEPFGPVTPDSIVVGHGAARGIDVSSHNINGQTIDKKLSMLTSETVNSLIGRDNIKGAMRRLLGLELDQDNRLVIAINGRAFRWNTLCAKYTSGCRRP